MYTDLHVTNVSQNIEKMTHSTSLAPVINFPIPFLPYDLSMALPHDLSNYGIIFFLFEDVIRYLAHELSKYPMIFNP